MKSIVFVASLLLAACTDSAAYQTAAVPTEHTVGGKTAADVFSDPRVADLARAACLGQVDAVEAAITAGADVNERGFQDVTTLIWALNCKNLEGVEALLDLGADADALFGDATALRNAAAMEDIRFLNLLLEHGADPNVSPPEGVGTALLYAFSHAMKGNGWENYYALLDGGADVNLVVGQTTIAEFAVSMNQYDKVADLLERGYSHDLDLLGRLMRRFDADIAPEGQDIWYARVREMLEERGADAGVQADIVAD